MNSHPVILSVGIHLRNWAESSAHPGQILVLIINMKQIEVDYQIGEEVFLPIG